MQKIYSLFSAFNTPKLQCPRHPTQFIHSLCLHEACSSPYICAQCKSGHSKDHSRTFESIKAVYDDKKLAEYIEVINLDASPKNIRLIKNRIFMVLQDAEEEFRKIISNLRQTIGESFEKLEGEVERMKGVLNAFDQAKNTLQNNIDSKYLIELVRSYKLIKQDWNKQLGVDLESLPSIFDKEVASVLENTKKELSSRLKVNIGFEAVDFTNLKVSEELQIPWSGGVASSAFAYIAKWDVLAFACRDGPKYSVGLYDLVAKNVSASVRSITPKLIVNVVWIDHKNYLLAGSDDSTIRVFKASNQGSTLRTIHTIRGHTQPVRSLKYIESERMLISAGYDTNAKLWSIENFRRYGTIHTNYEGNMNGSIAYIEADRLIGIAFRSGVIRFYRLRNRSLVFQLSVGGENQYGSQYLPKRGLIITTSLSPTHFKTWQYIEGEKRVTKEETISNQNMPYYGIASEGESQLLYYVNKSGRQSLEVYDFDTGKIALFDLPNKIRQKNCLILLGARGVLIGDYQSGNVCILHSKAKQKK